MANELPLWHYYEAHVTIDPVFDNELIHFNKICIDYKFRVAELLMKKRKQDAEERSSKDSFCTGRGDSLDDLVARLKALLGALRGAGFNVRRYKVESTLIDSQYEGIIW